MTLTDALIEGQVQLEWGRDSSRVEQAIERLRAVSPRDAMIRPLQMRLVELRVAETLGQD